MAVLTGAQLTSLVTTYGFEVTADFLRGMGSWLKEGANLAGDFPRSSAVLKRMLTADDQTAIRTALTEWLAKEPKVTDFVRPV